MTVHSSLTRIAELPGKCVGLVVHKDRLYCACEIERRWWQFWHPQLRVEVVEIVK